MLTKHDYHVIERHIVKFARRVLCGGACDKLYSIESQSIKYKSLTNKQVLTRMHMASAHAEIAIIRLRHMATMLSDLESHRLCLSVFLVSTPLSRSASTHG